MTEPSATLAFTLHSAGDAEIDTSAVSVSVDGSDVTAGCRVRVPRRWPANRADYAYRPPDGWARGEHEVTVAWPGVMRVQTWSFTADER